MSHQTLFPGYLTEAEERKLYDARLFDWSWGNDAMPMWSNVPASQASETELLLWTDAPDEASRECQGGSRFGVFLNNADDSGDNKILFEGDNLDEAIAAFKKHASLIKPPTPTQPQKQDFRTTFDVATDALTEALNRIEQNKGREGFRQPYDKAVHLYTALTSAGLKVVRAPKH